MSAPSVRVLHCLYHGGVGGAERSLFQLVSRQRDDPRVEVGALFAQGGGEYHERIRALVPTVAAGASSGHDVRAIPAMVRHMRRYDVHHFHSLDPLMFAASVLSGRRVRVYTERAGSVHEHYGTRKRLRNAVGGAFIRRAFHGFSGNTAHAARVGAERFRLPRDAFSVTYNGIRFELLEPRRDRDEVRRELGVPVDAFTVGTVAVLKDWKRVDRLIEAVSAVRGSPHAVVVGDGPERARLERLASERDVAARVVFAGTRIHVADDLAAMDAFVLPSNELESFGNAVIEAMALGLPSVVFEDSPGLREHVHHERTGFVVRDVRELARTLERLASDPQLRRSVGERAAQHVRSTYTLDRMADAYDALYRGAMAAAGRRRRSR